MFRWMGLTYAQRSPKTQQRVSAIFTRMTLSTGFWSRRMSWWEINIIAILSKKCQKNVAEAFRKELMICKLTDFGESWSPQVQTALLVNSSMQRLNRGTTVFCAQEAYHHQQGQGALFGIKHLKQVDAWAYGIVLFHLTRPEVSISVGFRCIAGPNSTRWTPALSQAESETDTFQQLQRIASNRVVAVWEHLRCLYSVESCRMASCTWIGCEIGLYQDLFLCENIGLEVSQISALQDYDRAVAQSVASCSHQMGGVSLSHGIPNNNITNACSFLCTKLCHDIQLICQERGSLCLSATTMA